MRTRAKLSPLRMAKYLLVLAVIACMTSVFAASTSVPTAATELQAQPDGAVSSLTSPLGPEGTSSIPVSPYSPAQIAVEGWVKDTEGNPVAGAVAALGGGRASADESGYFKFNANTVAQLSNFSTSTPLKLDITITAPGYAPWTISRARYYTGDTLRLYPHLAQAGHALVTLTAAQPLSGVAPAAQVAGPASAVSRLSFMSSGPRANSAFAVQDAPPTVPAQIRVYRTATGTVEVVPFKDYVKHVLPNEWVSTWAPDSLRAGAMAVKEYAWYWIARGGKQPSLGADVKDNTDDQVYDPNVSYASTDAAVDATWQYAMTVNGAHFQASYCAGTYQADPSVDCPWGGELYMTQWGSKYYADQGETWSWILRFYYPGVVISPTPPGSGNAPPPRPAGPAPTPVPAGSSYSVGEGSGQPEVFQAAYDRNGGEAVLGRPTGTVHWWLQYLSENNVLAQRLSGPDGKGSVWLVYDSLKSSLSGVNRAYMLSGVIGAAYQGHNPPGPEWIGAPTSDLYKAGSTGLLSQGFTNGTLSFNGTDVQFTPWPGQFNGWEADYFVGKPPESVQTGPPFDLPGQPANIVDVAAPDMAWPLEAAVPRTLGLASADWSVQFTRVVQVSAGTYDFSINADSGVRLWVDGLLAINSWTKTGAHTEAYEADLDGSPHKIRLQYFSPDSKGQLAFSMNLRSSVQPTQPSLAGPGESNGPAGTAGIASLRVKVRWLGRPAAPSQSLVQPLTLQLSVPGDPSIVGSYQGTTDPNGSAIFNNLPSGVYDVHVKGAHTLQSARASIGLSPGAVTDVDMRALIEGDIDGDNCVTVNDFVLVQAMVGTDKNTPGFDPRADLNGDGQVDLTDISLLRSGFDRCGDISADNDLYAMTSDMSPGASPDWSPWLKPEALSKNLSLGLYPSSPYVKVGDVVQVQVAADTGAQPIDGGSFLLHYDPVMLAPVDSSGNPTTISEPGLDLPSVLTNWVDPRGGSIGYAANMLQGAPPSGQVVLTTLRFRALRDGSTTVQFAPLTSSYMQLSNGGANLLASAHDLVMNVGH